ncbi:MAG TPA: ASCH domain-containing protein [Clostridia bacterium]|nr:ASCH domain-containing protein [Clostridia bacterium]
MEHEMRLLPGPFELIRSGSKTVEIRLYDEKRRKIGIGDIITFRKLPEEKELLRVEVEELYPRKTFEELYGSLPFEAFGCAGYSMERLLEGTYSIYTPDQEKSYGVLGIRIKPVCDG